MNYKEEIAKLENDKKVLEIEANFKMGVITGRIELLKELAAKEATPEEK